MTHIEKEWQNYRSKVLPKEASAIQVSECYKAFISGALSAIAVFGELETEEDVAAFLAEAQRLIETTILNTVASGRN